MHSDEEQHCDVLVAGGGLAGLSCAFELTEAGRRPLLLEAGPRFGGRTSSWIDDGMPVESGLHKFLGIYRDLPDLLQRAGVDTQRLLAWVDEIAILTPEQRQAVFGAAPYHHPLRTAAGALGNTHFISTWNKFRASRLGIAGVTRALRDPEAVDQLSIAEFARQFHLPDSLIRRLLASLTQGVFFLPPEQYSAYATFAPVIEGLKRGLTFRVGAFTGGMNEVMIDPLVRAIEDRGGRIALNELVQRLLVADGRVIGVQTRVRSIQCAHVVLATPLDAAQRLLREALPQHEWIQPILRLRTLSAVTIQFELTEPLLDTDRTHFSPTGLCCFAEQSRTTFRQLPGRLSAILFPPEMFLNMPDDHIADHAYREASSLGLELRKRVTRFCVVRHPHDFYAMTPGSEALRPRQQTPIPGLSLAGDYTNQPFLASMEGAAISGKLAAAAALEATGEPQRRRS